MKKFLLCVPEMNNPKKEQSFNISSNEHSNTTSTRNTGDKNCQTDKNVHIWPKKPTKDMWSNRPAAPIQNKMSMKHVVAQDGKNCQVNMRLMMSKMYSDKNCQEPNLMQPVKPPIYMQSVTRSSNKKLVGSESDKNCQATICYKKQRKSEYDEFQSQSSMCSDRNCQEYINVQPVMPEMNVWLPKPVVLYQYRRQCNDKSCQSTRCYKKRNYGKNCPSDNSMCYNKEI